MDSGSSSNFFSQLGKFGFSEGLLIDYPRLSRELLNTARSMEIPKQQVTSWNPARRRLARKEGTGTGSVMAATFQQLESFQYWQPFVEVGLVVSADLLPDLDPETTQYLLTYFDFLLIDARHLSRSIQDRSLDNGLAQLQSAGLLPKISVLLRHNGNDLELSGQLAELPASNIINWGYEYDDFLDRQPAAGIIRTFMSKASYPFR